MRRKHQLFQSFPWATFGRPESPRALERRLADQRANIRLFDRAPKFSLVIPVTDSVRADHFTQLLQSIREQSYAELEVLVAAEKKPKALHAAFSRVKDRRFKWLGTVPGGIADQFSRAAERAEGEWIVFLEADAVLHPSALFCFLREIHRRHPDVLYCNEIETDARNKRNTRFFSKPELSWFDLVHFDYIGPFFAVRKEALVAAGGIAPEHFPHSAHDLLLRLCERKATFVSLAEYLYHHRKRPENPVASLKPIVDAHFARMGFEAEVETQQLKALVVRPKIPSPKSHLISVIICYRDKAKWTARCLKSLAAQVGEVPVEVILVNNQSAKEEVRLLERESTRYPFPVRMIDYPHRFNYGAMHNWAIRHHAKGDVLFLLNNDVFFDGQHALDEFVRWVRFPWAGVVGCRLHFPDGSIQYGGTEARFGGFNRLVRIRHVTRPDNFTRQSKEVFTATFAACAIKRLTFDEIGGFDELDYYNQFGDTAFCFECLRREKRNLYLGFIHAEHLESASEGIVDAYWSESLLEDRYPDVLARMLRHDLGYDRVPRLDTSLRGLLKSGLGASLAENYPVLNPIKETLKSSRLFNRLLTSR